MKGLRGVGWGKGRKGKGKSSLLLPKPSPILSFFPCRESIEVHKGGCGTFLLPFQALSTKHVKSGGGGGGGESGMQKNTMIKKPPKSQDVLVRLLAMYPVQRPFLRSSKVGCVARGVVGWYTN